MQSEQRIRRAIELIEQNAATAEQRGAAGRHDAHFFRTLNEVLTWVIEEPSGAAFEHWFARMDGQLTNKEEEHEREHTAAV